MANDPSPPEPAAEPPQPIPTAPGKRGRTILSWTCLALGCAAVVLFVFEPFQIHDEDESILHFWVALGVGFVGALTGIVYSCCPPTHGRAGRRLRDVGFMLSAFVLGFSPCCLRARAFFEHYQLRNQSNEKLSTLALAMHNYAGAHEGRLPRTANGRPGEPGGLSWRVALLPYLGEEALYKEFHLDEPWDSPHNFTLLPRMPDVYRPPRNYRTPYATYYQVITGNAGAFRDNRAPRLPKDFNPRGTSNTILIVEAAEAVPWTKPADLVYDDGGPLPKFGGVHRHRFFAALADRSVIVIWWSNYREDVLRCYLKPDGTEPFPRDWQPSW
jgi:hypothetical protein